MVFGLFIDYPLLTIALILTISYRHKISNIFLKIRLPKFFILIIAALSFILFEEFINCPAGIGCVFLFLTVPILTVYVLIAVLFVKLTHTSRILPIITIFSIIGTLFEIFFGVASAEFQALPPLWIGIIGIYTFISYVILFVIPLTVQTKFNISKSK